jgi:acyl-coenzyme A thioesterase PaaI-like protein
MSLKVPFADHVGLETRERSEHRGVVVLPQREENTNHIGSQHAGALFTAAETASGAAVMGRFGSALAAGTVVPLVRHAGIQFGKIARGAITATGVVNAKREAVLDKLKTEGRVDFDVDVTLTDEAGVIVATTQVQWHLRATQPAA